MSTGDNERDLYRLSRMPAARSTSKKISRSSVEEMKYAKGSSSIFLLVANDGGSQSGGHE